jgi:predicted nucleic acid-binding protein
LIVAANQRVTKQWWESERSDFELFISQIVLFEIEAGDGEVAKLRLDLARQIPLLDVTPECDLLAERLLVEGALPRKATRDAFHIATAAFHRMDFLLTWNCRHIANDILIRKLGSIMKAQGYVSPQMCTPAQFLGRRFQ